MAMESDGTRQIIAEIRSLVHQCDQGQAARLQRLASPLPPMLQDDTQQALHGFHALTRFDPLGNIGSRFPASEQRGGNAVDPGLSPRSQGSSRAAANHNVAPTRRNSRTRQPVASLASQPFTSSNVSAMTSTRQASEPRSARHSSSVAHRSKKPTQVGEAEAQISNAASFTKRNDVESRDIDSIATELSTAENDNSSSTTSQRKRDPDVTTGPLISRQTGSSQTRQTTTRPKALSHTEALAAMRRAHAEERHKTDHKPNSVQRESSRGLSPNIGAGAPARDLSSSSPLISRQTESSQTRKDEAAVDASSLTSTPDKTAGNIPGVPMQTNRETAISESPATESAAHSQRGLSSSQPARAASSTQVEELDVKPAALASADRSPDSTPLTAASLPEENLAQQLADALYLHGIDRT